MAVLRRLERSHRERNRVLGRDTAHTNAAASGGVGLEVALQGVRNRIAHRVRRDGRGRRDGKYLPYSRPGRSHTTPGAGDADSNDRIRGEEGSVKRARNCVAASKCGRVLERQHRTADDRASLVRVSRHERCLTFHRGGRRGGRRGGSRARRQEEKSGFCHLDFLQ